ncbi:MAG: oligopeptidase [Microbacteriaceae bacterium]|nr:oligopeptidase [Microbacteriaceae bacterium]
MSDEYADWDAAYVLGSLSPSDRRDYERHLSECDACSAAVAELAGMSGLLSKVSVADATALLHTSQPIPMPQTLLPRLVRSARRRQLRTRGLVAGGIAAAAAVAAAIVLIVPLVFSGTPAVPASDRVVSLGQVVPTALSASVRLIPEGWGTRIDMDCSYGLPASALPYHAGDTTSEARGYAMWVTDSSGATTEVASWSAGPGSRVEPSASTSLSISQIESVDVRATDGTVLLKATL